LRYLCFFILFLFVSISTAAASVLPPIAVDIPKSEFLKWEHEFKSQEKVINSLLEDANLPIGESHYLNRLIFEASPYLLRHSVNPIDWQSWRDEVFTEAKNNKQLIFLSIGYSTCHWCHVMEKESFIDTDIANTLNSSFISIKVDRELNPEIDQYFTHALELIKGSAGWPITAVLTPKGEPIWLESYVSKSKLNKILKRLNTIWTKRPQSLEQVAKNITSQLSNNHIAEAKLWDKETPTLKFNELIKSIDNINGGLIGGPKFPSASLIELLLYQYQSSPNEALKTKIELSLNSLMNKGIRDHINGGFYRYATDGIWMKPHFEKMLYNQALLISTFSKAYLVFNNERYKAVVVDTINFVNNFLKSSAGGYYSAIDADYKGLEGRYYLYSDEELSSIAKGPLNLFEWYDFNDTGLKFPYVESQSDKTLEVKKSILALKSKLSFPHIDKKVLTSWNALMVSAYLDAYKSFGKAEHLKAAISLSKYLLTQHYSTDALSRARFMDKLAGKAMLDDYAYLSSAMLKLYLVTSEVQWLNSAINLYRSGSRLFAKDYSGNQVQLNNQLDDGELISAHAVLTDVGIKLNDLGVKVHYKELVYQFKQGFINNSKNDFFSNEILLKEKYGTFDNMQFFARGNGKVSFELVDKKVYLKFKMKPGWHVNSNVPNQKFLIATKVNYAENLINNIEYPKAINKKLGFSQSTLSLFEDDFEIKIELDNVNPLGELIEVNLQACSDKVCLLPEKLKFFISGD